MRVKLRRRVNSTVRHLFAMERSFFNTKLLVGLTGLVSLMVTPVIRAQTKPDRLVPEIAWARSEGKLRKESADSLQRLGITNGPANSECYALAFRNTDDNSLHTFEVLKDSDSPEIIIIHKTSQRIIAWRVSKNGNVLRTIRVDPDNTSRVVADADYAKLYATELENWDSILPDKYKSSKELASTPGDVEQIIGRERRERVSHHNWSGDA